MGCFFKSCIESVVCYCIIATFYSKKLNVLDMETLPFSPKLFSDFSKSKIKSSGLFLTHSRTHCPDFPNTIVGAVWNGEIEFTERVVVTFSTARVCMCPLIILYLSISS